MIPAAAGESTHKAGRIRINRLVETLLFLLFAAAIFQFPEHPQLGLDPSWKMALGQTFHDGRQFGRDVVYNYGPLGFLMGNMYFGLQFWSLVSWQLFATFIFSAIIIRNGRSLQWEARVIYMLVFLFYGIIYPDALYMITIALMGIELIRCEEWHWISSRFFALFFAAVSLMKFTNMVFAVFVIAVICIDRCRLRRWRDAVWIVALFCGGGLLLWIICHQNPLNFPAYLRNSWQISKGYEEAMGTPTPSRVLWKGVIVLAILGIYMILHAVLQRNKPRAIASLAILVAFIFLDWKHGFVRADAHMLVFFISALVPVAAFPALMDDVPRWRWLQRSLLVCAGVFCILGVRDVMQTEETDPPYVRAGLRESIRDNISHTLHWSSFLESYETSLQEEKENHDLPVLRKIIGNGTVDVIGNEQAVAFYNGFRYSPRPVFQSFAAYTPALEKLNDEFFASEHAPDFVLVKIQTIDERLAALDDASVLRLLPERYDYTNSEEHGYALWKRRVQQPQVVPGPQPLQSEDLVLDTRFAIGELAAKSLWVKIDLHTSLSGRLRRFLYKPAVVKLTIEDTDGVFNTYSMPLPETEAGFILNPLIEDNAGYLAFAKGEKGRFVRSMEIEVADSDKRFFDGPAHVEFFELPGRRP